ncbi:Com family DNA-binding transcriptional regulator [Candidatus Saganbacteria bacterium]|nr:Com family DNA-binding transcriptional regulator [Candidatus Saganbacteria bacterium]
MKEFRCKFCHRLLAKVGEAKKVEIKCPKCKTMNLFRDDEVLVVEIDETHLRKQILKGKITYSVINN